MKNTRERTIPQTFTLSMSLREVLYERARKEGVPISAIVQRALVKEFSSEKGTRQDKNKKS